MNFVNKKGLIKAGTFMVCLVGLVGFSQLKGLSGSSVSHVVNANADGTVNCGGAGSGCSVTFNGTATTVHGYKQPAAQ